jgi:hypothetical protein
LIPATQFYHTYLLILEDFIFNPLYILSSADRFFH